jgi:hypothetical protein
VEAEPRPCCVGVGRRLADYLLHYEKDLDRPSGHVDGERWGPETRRWLCCLGLCLQLCFATKKTKIPSRVYLLVEFLIIMLVYY